MSETESHSSSRAFWITLVGVFVVSLVAYGGWYVGHVAQWGPNYANAGAFGDAFGPVTGLLSTLALSAAVASVFIQRQELELQRAELRLQRQELADTRDVLAKQQRAQEELTNAQVAANRIAEMQRDVDRDYLEWDAFRLEVELEKMLVERGTAATPSSVDRMVRQLQEQARAKFAHLRGK